MTAEEKALERMSTFEMAKDLVYRERNQLVSALSVVLPAWLERHPESDTDWEDDWRWIVFIDHHSTGQMSWHIHDSELIQFEHLKRRLHGYNSWDGHTVDEKYERLARLDISQFDREGR